MNGGYPAADLDRSATEYELTPEQAQSIIQVAGYHDDRADKSVITFLPGERTAIYSSITTPFQRPSKPGLSYLDRLPFQLQCEIVSHMDMKSIFSLRQTNLRARQLVDSLEMYRLVATHSLDVLCALLRTKLATDVSLLSFYNLLSAKSCVRCGAYGSLISLLVWKRCCFLCLFKPEFRIQTLTTMRKKLHLPPTEVRLLRSFKTLPGIYRLDQTAYYSRYTVVSVAQVLSVTESSQHLLDIMSGSNSMPHLGRLWSHERLDYMGACALPHYDKSIREIETGVSCAGCRQRINPLSFLEPQGMLSKDDFLSHFKWCKQAQLIWESSQAKEKAISEQPGTA